MFCMDDIVPKDYMIRLIDKAIDWSSPVSTTKKMRKRVAREQVLWYNDKL